MTEEPVVGKAPKAFISHAWEDKERFVLPFAKSLRAKGVDAWLDRWEIKAGESIVNKIFEEGIRNSDTIIIVISSFSINKPWCREELDAAMVRKINQKCRLIPILVEDCQVPEALHHICWIRIRNLNHYENELSQVLSSILGTSEKPPLGNPPVHAQRAVISYLPGLTKADHLVFGILCHNYFQYGFKYFSIGRVEKEFAETDMSESEINESLEVLKSRGFIDVEYACNTPCLVRLSTHSLDLFLHAEHADYERILFRIICMIVNEEKISNNELTEALSISRPIISHFLEVLESNGLLELCKTCNGYMEIGSKSPELKRMLQ